MLGILLIHKPVGITSHDVVNQIRRRLGTKRVGHAGTLDPLASGLLVVAVGPATRFLQYLPLEPKGYRAQLTFGFETDTQDGEGERINPRPIPEDLEARLRDAIPLYLGLIEQIPPAFSAVKVAGKPLYKYAREGKVVEREPRTVHVAAIEVLSVGADSAEIRIECSGGTYVRSLAHDLGQTIGCGAFLSGLVRERSGRFEIGMGIAPEEASPEKLLSLREALPPMAVVELNEAQTYAIRHGQAVGVEKPPHARLAALAQPNGAIIGVARVIGNQLQPECVLPLEAEPNA